MVRVLQEVKTADIINISIHYMYKPTQFLYFAKYYNYIIIIIIMVLMCFPLKLDIYLP